MRHHGRDRRLRPLGILEADIRAPDAWKPFGRRNRVQADDQARDIAVQFHDIHTLPVGRYGLQQIPKAIEFRVDIAHGRQLS